jgi:hypothetical protein
VVQCRQARIDTSFAALSDATLRGVLERLGRADASITDLYPTKEALDDANAFGSTGGISETFERLDEHVVTLASC